VAVAVNTAELLVLAVSVSKAEGESSELSADWNVDNELFRVPSAEICAVTACVWLLIRASWGAWVAATSCETSELTSMTEPPAAAALELLAIETGAPVVPVAVLTVLVSTLPAVLMANYLLIQ
jgi:hypothetical protein